uniref:Uncharacterized protein n=1 Tax=Siphoviridae sp. ctsi73 TaxID=2825698 RepID=A0A8S5QI16_9CAUD|nr:MAG TPA: hypothetical protein [Siphoviridae sp. ctsi73]
MRVTIACKSSALPAAGSAARGASITAVMRTRLA